MNFKKPAGVDMHGSKRIGLADDIDGMGLPGMRDAKPSGSDYTSTLLAFPEPFAFQHHVELIGIVEMNRKGIRLDLCSDLQFDAGNGSRSPERKSRPRPPARWAARFFPDGSRLSPMALANLFPRGIKPARRAVLRGLMASRKVRPRPSTQEIAMAF